jgi:hypothetical protein
MLTLARCPRVAIELSGATASAQSRASWAYTYVSSSAWVASLVSQVGFADDARSWALLPAALRISRYWPSRLAVIVLPLTL